MTVRARYDGKAFVPIDPVDLQKDQMVELEVRESTDIRNDSPEFLRQLMRRIPALEAGDAAALEAAIEQGKRPVRYDHIFDEPNGE